MKCRQCGSEWNVNITVSNKIKKCPFCGWIIESENIHSANEIDSIEEAIREIYRIGGEKTICSTQLVGYFSDLASVLRKYNVLIKNLISMNGNISLFEAALLDETHRKIQIIRVAEKLQANYFLDRNICIELCENFCRAIYLENQKINKTGNENTDVPINIDEEASVLKKSKKSVNSYYDSKNSCSIKKIEEMAEQEDSEAQYTLAEYYYKQKQLSEAFIWYERASNNGNSNALYKKSIMLGMSGNYKEAAKNCRKAAVLGNAVAQYEYAVMVEKGIGTFQDIDVAKKWYHKAAEQGHTQAKKRYDMLKVERKK